MAGGCGAAATLRAGVRPAVLLALALGWLIAGVAVAQGPAGDAGLGKAAASERIAGHVVSALDGHPLGGATVLIGETPSGRMVQTVVADESGAFVFTGMKLGKYSLQGVAPGYLAASYDEHEQFSTAIVTGAGLPTEALVLRLPPAAVLSGHVTDEAGEPVRGAGVTLYRETHGEGTSRITRFRNAVADDLGAYEMGALPPGNYFVSAKGVPWYAVHPPQAASPGDVGVVSSIDPSLNVAYATVFYPGVTDSDGATPIPMKAGDQVTADLRVAPQPALRLTIHLGNDPQSRSVPQIMRPVFDDFEPVDGPVQMAGADAEVDGLAPGRYQLRQSDPRTGGTAKMTVVDLASRSAEVSTAEGEEPGAVKLMVRDASGAALPPRMQISLLAKERGIGAGQVVNEKGEAEFSGLKPGQYHLAAYGGERQYHVLRLAVDGREAADRLVQVGPGSRLAVTASIAAGAIGVEGVAKRDGVPAAGAMIVLVPRDPESNAELFRRDQSDLDGTFLLQNVTPGTYTVLAIENGWTLEWGRANILTRYLAKGVVVTVPAAGRTSVRITEPVVVQAR